jgi:hypothetical protein
MILEWIHYYTKLGFRVMVFDRDGLNRKVLRGNQTHAQALKIDLSGHIRGSGTTHLTNTSRSNSDGHHMHDNGTAGSRDGYASHHKPEHGAHTAYHNWVYYYPYTIRGLLDPKSHGIKYDNNEVRYAVSSS